MSAGAVERVFRRCGKCLARSFFSKRSEVIVYRNLVWLPLATLIGLLSAFSMAGASDEATTAVGPAEVISGVTAEVMSVVAEAKT